MTPLLLDGRKASQALLESLKKDVASLNPSLTVVQVGDDPASTSYIAQKMKSCDTVGMRHEHRHLPADTTLEDLFAVIEELNTNPDVTGFIVQLPLPVHLSQYVPQVIRAINPMKDVDGFCAYNLGKMFLSKEFEHLPPATPSGVMQLLAFYDIEIEGKDVVVVGHSNTVGKPLSTMFLNRNATVTTCHIHTKDLARHTREADILAVAVGKPGLISADMVKEGAVVVDIGITKTESGLKGDVDFDSVSQKASAITPVPGGVGPMTVASLIRNCVRAKQRQLESEKSENSF
ncbi:bifunctional methylenetetrahydrofolate dehydrogenase/methenyltetrahydrofolate cyclohydrolase [Candidatus Peregrinibacteria bacterium CG10_big_fil_rev_8_21_14_0_10_49_24]|nr:MAG: bifunctional methylenetetrahydrofolate dehydrogenase/methenyltetrahydrofolate cyclohydrolase [Candidatus Peregrinibacteria bacterium CG11_big_fil_rev_8_21_14_0_20_49_14]PIR50735.1 MAG: bifunctional methylenetetrahydrofolate dehydrogenase/methenyltetrahydrofolate cyclohydrolase [Candidatus Peregrinibacteria bacterium CG10_big_fil_rev_8_21_14_0_10_49_24]PJA68220.1 MAG: bifunctional methylenetetrahydrofolate dehydrogenase/methenyltetrahydrofolate cyclohydrolase [Candidatus Peregrinibacteria 